MVWNSDRAITVAALQREARALGTLVDRAIVREIKYACSRMAATDAAWLEVIAMVERWKDGMRDLEVLSELQRLTRSSLRRHGQHSDGEHLEDRPESNGETRRLIAQTSRPDPNSSDCVSR